MGFEQDVSLALYRHAAGHDQDMWGEQARIVAHGIEKSGITALLRETTDVNRVGFDDVTQAVMRSAVLTSQGLAAVAGMISAQTRVLEQLADMLRCPLGTAARELYERGIRALNAGWTEEAVTELSASVEKDPYDPVAQFALGLAHGASGDNQAASAAMGRAIRYSSDQPKLASLAAGAAILGANAYVEVGDLVQARRLVAQTRVRVTDCAELELMAGRLGNDADATARAIAIAPELALDAVSLGLPGAAEAAERSATDGAVDAMYQAHAAWSAMGRFAAGKYAPRLPDRDNAAKAVRAHPDWVRTQAPELRRVAEQVRRDEAAAREAVDEARAIVREAPTSGGAKWGVLRATLYWVNVDVEVAYDARKRKIAAGEEASEALSSLERRATDLADAVKHAGQLEAALARACPPRTWPLAPAGR